jgi:hypothetical protein
MPTGYTADVVDGKIADLRTFTLRCARAFGATIMQRDDPMDVLPVPRKVEPYYQKSVIEAQQKVAHLKAMTPGQIALAADAEYDRLTAMRAEWDREADEKRERCAAMLAQVEAWEPPTADHAGLKRFMVEQLTETMRFDGARHEHTVERLSPNRWHAQKLERAYRTLGQAERSLVEERDRVERANGWIRQLYESLEGQHVS